MISVVGAFELNFQCAVNPMFRLPFFFFLLLNSCLHKFHDLCVTILDSEAPSHITGHIYFNGKIKKSRTNVVSVFNESI